MDRSTIHHLITTCCIYLAGPQEYLPVDQRTFSAQGEQGSLLNHLHLHHEYKKKVSFSMLFEMFPIYMYLLISLQYVQIVNYPTNLSKYGLKIMDRYIIIIMIIELFLPKFMINELLASHSTAYVWSRGVINVSNLNAA